MNKIKQGLSKKKIERIMKREIFKARAYIYMMQTKERVKAWVKK